MKIARIVLFLSIVALSASACYGEITKKKDAFSGITTISSSQDTNVSPFALVGLNKFIGNKTSLTAIVFWRIESEWWFFKGDADMKIGEEIISLPIVDQFSKVASSSVLNTTSARYRLIKDIKAKMLTADSIIFRIYYSNQISTTWEVPQSVLAEWKEVLVESVVKE